MLAFDTASPPWLLTRLAAPSAIRPDYSSQPNSSPARSALPKRPAGSYRDKLGNQPARRTIMLPASWGQLDANISMLFNELPMTGRPAGAQAAGFTAIEAWWPFTSALPSDAQAAEFERAVRDAGVEHRRDDVTAAAQDELAASQLTSAAEAAQRAGAVPGRHEPGTGTADLDGWVRRLRELGYAGPIGLEYAPAESTLAGLR
jgi:hydroxypyruvate isomerase